MSFVGFLITKFQITFYNKFHNTYELSLKKESLQTPQYDFQLVDKVG
jgi:hypothetical protein